MTGAVDDVLTAAEAGARVIRGSAGRVAANVAGIVLGVVTAALLLHHLGLHESGRYVVVLSLVAIPVAVADLGLNVSASRELALRAPDQRPALIANVLALRLLAMPLGVLLTVAFALAAGYPARMVIGTALAGAGAVLAGVGSAYLLRLTVELRNAGLAFVDFLKQAVTLACAAILVALGARLTPFFAVLIVTGLAVIAVVPLLAGRDAIVRPRFDRADQRLLIATALPVATALGIGQVYFRLVILLMSLISSVAQYSYFGASLRAMEALVNLPILITAVSLPMLAAAARDDASRLRYAVASLGKGAVIAGVLIVIVTVRAAEPAMAFIGGPAFRPAGAVLRIQVGALLFIALYQIWAGALLAVGRQRELLLANGLALAALALFAGLLVPPFGAQGGAVASVCGDAVLAGLIYWRLAASTGRVMVPLAFIARVAVAAAAGCGVLLIPDLSNLAAAALAGVAFLVVGQLVGMIPREIIAALRPRR